MEVKAIACFGSHEWYIKDNSKTSLLSSTVSAIPPHYFQQWALCLLSLDMPIYWHLSQKSSQSKWENKERIWGERLLKFMCMHAYIHIYAHTKIYIHMHTQREKYPFIWAARSELKSQTYFVVEKWGQAQGGRPSALSKAQQILISILSYY